MAGTVSCCSNGGRPRVLATQREPLLFDGIFAGNPGLRPSRAAPRDVSGRGTLSAARSLEDLRLVADAVLARCDAADGLVAGQVRAMQACRFAPAALRCTGEKAADCLAAPQVGAPTPDRPFHIGRHRLFGEGHPAWFSVAKTWHHAGTTAIALLLLWQRYPTIRVRPELIHRVHHCGYAIDRGTAVGQPGVVVDQPVQCCLDHHEGRDRLGYFT